MTGSVAEAPPGLAIFVIGLALSLASDALRDLLAPGRINVQGFPEAVLLIPPERARIGLDATQLDARIAELREWVCRHVRICHSKDHGGLVHGRADGLAVSGRIHARS